MSIADKTLTCTDCGSPFTFTEGEQQFYQMKGLMNEPKRCPSCRSAAKVARQSGTYASGGGFRAQREMHDVICAECGAETQVPFLPRNDRPVYCSDCFDKVRAR